MYLLWLYFDPQREILFLPFFHRPIMWYGLFFALGFAFAYMLFERGLRYLFLFQPKFLQSDIQNFERFLMTLKNHQKEEGFSYIWEKLPKNLIQRICHWNLNLAVDTEMKQSVIKALNDMIEDESFKVSGLNVNKLTSVKQKFLAASLSYEDYSMLIRRLYLESLFNCSLDPFKIRVKLCAERLSILVALGAVVGARLGHVLFYEDAIFYLTHPLNILKVWEGGLASHGGVIGICVALGIFLVRFRHTYPFFNFINILDELGRVSLLAAFFIRVGNFFNQEILGTPSYVPWAIIFGHPADGSYPIPRHPAQLYEAFFYLAFFSVLWALRYKPFFKQEGKISGVVLIGVFTFRFFIEFIKEEQALHTLSFLNMGQLLSFPIVALGLYLCFRKILNQVNSLRKLEEEKHLI